jgi:hypothetical protein
MSSVSGVGASTPQVAPAPASQNPVAQNPPAPADKNDKVEAAPKPNTVQPSKPPGQGQVVYIST